MQEVFHPRPNDDGKPVVIKKPSTPTLLENWSDANKAATVLPDGPMPPELNGLPLTPWADAPTTASQWAKVPGQGEFSEPTFPAKPGMKVSAGVIVQEPDGRLWVVHPSNAYGGYRSTFPKGTVEPGIPMRASAIKEAFEEAGLRVELTGFFKDSLRTTSVARYYTARRIGGTPSACLWESQAVSLVPLDRLADFLHAESDKPLLATILKGA